MGEGPGPRAPPWPGWAVLDVRKRHGGNGAVAEFRVGTDAGRFAQRGEALQALAHLAAVAARLRLAQEGDEELFPGALLAGVGGFQRGAAFAQGVVRTVFFLADAGIARRETDHRHQERHQHRACRE